MLARALPVLVMFALLAGCAPRGPMTGPDPGFWEQRREQLGALDSWEARGRIALRDSRGEGGQGSVRWKQREGDTRIVFSGPLGTGSWAISWDGETLVIDDGDDQRMLTGADPAAVDRFVFEHTGWWLPAIAARYWLLGLRDPSVTALEELDASGRPLAIEQHGWRIRYERWMDVGTVPMPRRVVMEDAQARVRIVIDRWQL